MLTVRSIHVYPVKSLRGRSVATAEVGDRGFAGDRRFMVVDEDGRFLTQRALPRMSLVAAEVAGAALRLSAAGHGTVEVPLRPDAGAARTVQVWRDRCDAVSAGEPAARWLTAFLGRPCELVYMPDETLRATDAAHGPGRVGFADAYPFLVASTSSLAELARRGADVPMERFRPSLVVDGAPPFAEDGWKRLRVGPVAFRVTTACVRCVVTTVDPELGATAGDEPLRTLATFRRSPDGVTFGVNAVHEGSGTIRVGEPVEIAS